MSDSPHGGVVDAAVKAVVQERETRRVKFQIGRKIYLASESDSDENDPLMNRFTRRISSSLVGSHVSVDPDSIGSAKKMLQHSRQEKIIRGIEREFVEPTKLQAPDRYFLKDGTMNKIGKFGLKRGEVMIHLFTDVLLVSEITTRGLKLKHQFHLRDSDVNTFAELGKRSNASSLVFSIKDNATEVVFQAENMKEMMAWNSDLKLMMTRARDGQIGIPPNWSKDGNESKFVNKKTNILKERRMNRRSKISIMMAKMQEEEQREFVESPENEDSSTENMELSDSEFAVTSNEADFAKKIDGSDDTMHSARPEYVQPANSSMKLGKSRQEDTVDAYTHFTMQEQIKKEKHKTKVLLKKMHGGAKLYKYNSEGKPFARYFKVSKDGEKLLWGKRNGKYTSKVVLAEVSRLEYGPFTERFKNYRWEWGQGAPWLCFTIHVYCPMRTIDIECSDVETLRTWFLGLQALIPSWVR